MPTISSDAEFYIVMSEVVSKAINDVLDKIFKELRQEIEREIYSGGSRGTYKRSHALPDAWEVTTRGLFGLLEFRPDMLPSDPESFQHNSPYGWDIREIIFDILEGGYRAYNAKTGRFIFPRPMWDNFLQKVDSKIDKWVRAALRKQGLVVI